MKIKNVNLEWYIPRMEFNSNELKDENILGGRFNEEIAKEIRNKKIKTKEDLIKTLKIEFAYHYWSKCEAEYEVMNLFEKDIKNARKVDMYRYIEPNLESIADYIIYKMQLELR